MMDRELDTQIEDVDDVIGLAAEMMRDEQDVLSADDMRAVATELDIPPEYMERARKELTRRRTEAKRLAAQAQARKKRFVKVSAIVLAVTTAVIALWGWSAVSSLRAIHTTVEAQRAQLANVRTRKTAVQQQLAGRPDSVDKDAELIGAENRIRVESQRYATIAAQYNSAAASFPASMFAPLAGLPRSVPLDP